MAQESFEIKSSVDKINGTVVRQITPRQQIVKYVVVSGNVFGVSAKGKVYCSGMGSYARKDAVRAMNLLGVISDADKNLHYLEEQLSEQKECRQEHANRFIEYAMKMGVVITKAQSARIKKYVSYGTLADPPR